MVSASTSVTYKHWAKPLPLPAVLPDEDGRVTNFVNMAFDDDPMTDHPMLTQMPPKKRQKAAGVHSRIKTHKCLQPCHACI